MTYSSSENHASLDDVKSPHTETLKRLAISETGFIFDPVTGYSFSVNETGLFILHELQKGEHNKNILEKLLDNYELNYREAERDLIEYIGLLRKQLEGNPE